jgi:hypothetical protein
VRGIYPPGLTKSLRVVAYRYDAKDRELSRELFNGKLESPKPQMVERLQKAQLYDQTIAVADRIPDALLDELRRTGNGLLGIKLRIHPDGPLLGWHIEYRPNFSQSSVEELKNLWTAPAYSHTGGDFKEARAAWYTWQGDHMRGLPEQIPEFSIKKELNPLPWRWGDFIALPHAKDLGYKVPQAWAEQGFFITNANDPCCNTRVKNRLWEKGWYIHPKTGKRIETYY